MLLFRKGWVVWCDNVAVLSTSAFLETNSSTKIHPETFSGLVVKQKPLCAPKLRQTEEMSQTKTL